MIAAKTMQFDWGQRVTALMDLFNDGSHPEAEQHALLVKQGTSGEIVQVGMHEETATPVYMVEFAGNRVVGCLENEIIVSMHAIT